MDKRNMTQQQEKALVQKFNSIGIAITEIEDLHRGKGWNRYLLNGWTIWICSKGWTKAREVGGHYFDDTYHSNLEEAILSAHADHLKKTLAYFEGKNIDEKHLHLWSTGF